jgi:hypothetical protein
MEAASRLPRGGLKERYVLWLGKVQSDGRTYLISGDIEGKLDVLRVECTKCDRKGRYHVHRLSEKYGRNGNMMKWREMLNADCPKRYAHSLHERCDLICMS